VLADGDLLVGMDGDFNCGRWRGGPALLNQRVCKISVDESVYEPRLLDALLPVYLSAINAETSSVTVKHLSSRTIEGIWLPLPPRAEQVRLADKLDELLGDLVSATRELKAVRLKLARYRQSLLRSAVEGSLTADWRLERARRPLDVGLLPDGWSWVPLSQCCSVVSGYAFSSKSFIASGIPVAKIANVGHGCFVDRSGTDHLAVSFEESHADFLVEPGDILIALTRPITNDRLKSCRYPDGRPRALLNQRVAALRPLDPDLASYLFHVTCSTYFRECMAAAATQTLQPNVSPHSLRSFLVPIPPTEEAVFIADCLDQALSGATAVESEVDRALDRCNAQHQNILRAAFSGQLVPQDPSDEPASVLLERIRAQRPVSAAAAKRKPGRRVKVAA
jgi:type I restriction enzyme S subunit